MVWLALIVGGAVLAAFAVMVVSIRLCERRKSLFDPARGGPADAFTRKLLALHVDQAGLDAGRPHDAAAPDLVRR
jgi:hypothetical protein